MNSAAVSGDKAGFSSDTCARRLPRRKGGPNSGSARTLGRYFRVMCVLTLTVCFTSCGNGEDAASSRSVKPESFETPEDEIAYLTKTIKEDTGGHVGWTPAVDRLVEIGQPAIPAVLDVAVSGDEIERICAENVLWEFLTKRLGRVPGQPWDDPAGEQEARRLWRELGDLGGVGASKQEREASVKLWREWLKKQRLADVGAATGSLKVESTGSL